MPITISGDAPNFTSASATTITGVTTLNASSGVLATQNGMNGVAKAWVNFTGSTGAIQSSFNVSSVTVNSTGNYTINFTTAMPNANYVTIGNCSQDNTVNSWASFGVQLYTYPTTSSTRVLTGYYSGSSIALNPVTVCVAVLSN
jgi:hypothetical protein